MMTSRPILLLILSVLSMAAPAGGLLAQETPSQPPPTESEEPVPEEPAGPAAIPVSDIAVRAEESANRLREIGRRLETDPEVESVLAKMPTLAEEVDTLKDRPDAVRPATLTLRQLEEARAVWAQHRRQFDNWQEVLEARMQTLQAFRERMQALRTTWEMTRSAALKEEVPEEVMDRIGSILDEIERLETRGNDRRNELLTAQNRISEEATDIGAILDRIDAGVEEARQRVLSAESAPLWRALRSIRDEDGLLVQLRHSLEQDRAAFARFLDVYGSRLPFHLGLFLILLVPMAILRRQSREWARQDSDLETAAHILGRPVSAALLVAVLLTVPLYPERPRIVGQLAALAAVIPVLRLLPGLVYSNLRKPLYGLVWLFILFLMHGMALEESILQRLILFLVDALALAGLGWILRPGAPIARLEQRGPWGRLAVNLSRLGMVILGVALIANLIGNVTLAELLTRGVFGAVYLAVILLAAVLVLDGFVAVLLRTRQARTLRMVRIHSDFLIRRGRTLIHLGALLFWLSLVLPMFTIWEPLKVAIGSVLRWGFKTGNLQFTVGDIIAFVITLWLAVWISRSIRFVLQEDILSRVDLPRGVPATISMMVHYSIVTLGFVIALAAAGIELSQFALMFGALGVGIGFGLQNLVNNFVSGLILAFERPIQLGDTVEVGTLIGQVRRIGIRSSTVRTFEGAEVIVPNGNLISNEVINWTLSDRLRRVNVEVGVAYGTDPKRVLEILAAVAKNNPDVLDRPAPDFLFTGFGESSLNFLMRIWTARSDVWWTIRSDLAIAVNDALKENGIEIPFPQRDLHLRSIDPGVRDAVRGGREPEE